MKNTLFAAIAITAISLNANAATNCCGSASCAQQAGASYDASCTTICSCTDSASTQNGVKITTKYTQQAYCVGKTAYSHCVAGTTTYKCASNYYGTPTSSNSGCTPCPENAYCYENSNSIFKCQVGYYQNGDKCEKCPDPTNFTINNRVLTAGMGATSINECYLNANPNQAERGVFFTDDTGTGVFSEKCYY